MLWLRYKRPLALIAILSATPGVQKQEDAFGGFAGRVDDLGFRRLTQAQKHLVEDAGLQQSRDHPRRGGFVAHFPALAPCPPIESAGEPGVTGAGRHFVVAPAEFWEAMGIAGNDTV